MAYSFASDQRLCDLSFKRRLDAMVRAQHHFLLVNAPSLELHAYLSGFAVVQPINPEEFERYERQGCLLWQDVTNRQQQTRRLIERLITHFNAGVIEACDSAQWHPADFTVLGLDWRCYGPGRGNTDHLIGYWHR